MNRKTKLCTKDYVSAKETGMAAFPSRFKPCWGSAPFWAPGLVVCLMMSLGTRQGLEAPPPPSSAAAWF